MNSIDVLGWVAQNAWGLLLAAELIVGTAMLATAVALVAILRNVMAAIALIAALAMLCFAILPWIGAPMDTTGSNGAALLQLAAAMLYQPAVAWCVVLIWRRSRLQALVAPAMLPSA